MLHITFLTQDACGRIVKRIKGGHFMKKPAYFIIQLLWSFILATIIWFGFLSTASVDGDNSIAAIMLFGGGAFYLLLTVAYIILGYKKVADFGIALIVVAIVINIVMLILGFFGATAASALFIKLFGIKPFFS